jgi:type II secretory ATPase GspE/PulE/Tfp pilus assembly ATPase PilB-like protein
LIRKLCDHCKQPDTLSTNLHHHLQQPIYQPVGCEYCHQGYQGRVGIFEFIPITEKISSLILSESTAPSLLTHIKKEKWSLLSDVGLEKVQAGITSLAEIIRVVGNATDNATDIEK